MDRIEIAVISLIVCLVLMILVILFSGGCEVQWRTLDGAQLLNENGKIEAKSLAVKEEPGWTWRMWGWSSKIRIWNAYRDSDDSWEWVSDDGETRWGHYVENMWNSWNAQIKTGITRPEGAEDQEIIQEAKRLLDNSNTEEDNPTND